MINYADYEFYAGIYKGKLSFDLFDSLIPKASREIDKAVNRELQETDVNNKVKFVACELVDFLNTNPNISSGNKLSSFSIDGVTKHFVQKAKEEIEKEKSDILKNLPQELTRFL